MSYFSYVGRLFSNVKGFYNEINAATLTGAIDVIIVEQEDGSFKSSPFHVRFGKLGVLRAREKLVDIEINGEAVDLHMKLGESGEAFFVTEIEEEEDVEEIPAHLATSPMPSDVNLMEKGVKDMKKKYLGDKKKRLVKRSKEDPDHQESVSKLTEQNETSRKARKKRPMKRKPADLAKTKDEHEIFQIEDVDISSDEELANLPMHSMSKSVSLPVVEENKFQRTEEWAQRSYDGFPHVFSDIEMSPISSPVGSRPPSPKSDTEFECQRSSPDNFLIEEDTTLWEWGDLPRQSVTELKPVTAESDKRVTDLDNKQSSSGLFQFMKTTRNVRHKPELEGIYLDDLNLDEMSPDVAKLYFPKRFNESQFQSISQNEDDAESGRGSSLPVSPHSVEGAVCGPPATTFLQSEVEHLGHYSMSLCGGLAQGVTLEKFMQKIVTFEDLCDNFNMINNPDLVIRIGEQYYNWQTAAPLILADVVFDKSISETAQKRLKDANMPKKKEKRASGMSSWFSWGRSAKVEEEKEEKLVTHTSMSDSEIGSKTAEPTTVSPPTSLPSSVSGSPRKVRKDTDNSLADDDQTSSEAETDSDKNDSYKDRLLKEKYKKTIRLDSESIKKLNLRMGCNEIVYSVTTQFQGTKRCNSHIYLWRYDDKIIVSDIDGTITKSDVLGQILPIIGRDWSQSGVAQLYTSIQTNGYKFLYLSARAIGQSKVTKDLLKSIKQEVHVLPEGPLLLSPTSLVSAFHREVIEKKPEEFKIACLKDIGCLFPSYVQPFYAGFGNKINDVYAYSAINIPPYRIFTINPRGELKQESHFTFQSSYIKLSDIADHYFPPVIHENALESSEFSNTTFWRQPIEMVNETELNDIVTSVK